MPKHLTTADISAEQAARWPKSKALADEFVVCHAVVHVASDGLRAALCSDAQEADELAVRYQRQGHRAWMVTLEGDGLLVHND